MNDVLLELYRHKNWATVRLIEHCQGLADEHLDATIPGTYGTIRDTLRHLVGAEERYFWSVTGDRLAEPFPDGPVPLAELAERIRRLDPRWEILAQDADARRRAITTRDGWRTSGVVPMAQAIHHADDHRSHILSILGALGWLNADHQPVYPRMSCLWDADDLYRRWASVRKARKRSSSMPPGVTAHCPLTKWRPWSPGPYGEVDTVGR